MHVHGSNQSERIPCVNLISAEWLPSIMVHIILYKYHKSYDIISVILEMCVTKWHYVLHILQIVLYVLQNNQYAAPQRISQQLIC